MVKVSGVPYEVDLPHGLDEAGLIAELERENAMMRARMQRLEDENRMPWSSHRTDKPDASEKVGLQVKHRTDKPEEHTWKDRFILCKKRSESL
jgi:hypothetical protein